MPGETTYTILIVEDDATIARLLQENLARWGFDARCVEDFSDVLGAFEAARPHLTLLDISLPYYNGYYWCDRIRRVSSAPILFLSSRSDNMDVVMAVNMGGDDYVAKPFSMEVLIAKINALLRRAYRYAEPARTLSVGGATLNLDDGSLSVGAARVELTRNESRILFALLEKKNTVVSREEIMRRLWDDDSFVDDNTLTVNINRLRKKLDSAGLSSLIETKRGEGYIVHD